MIDVFCGVNLIMIDIIAEQAMTNLKAAVKEKQD
jgi:hypothetical protein